MKPVGPNLIVVSGATAYLIGAGFGIQPLGFVGNDGLPASIVNNITQTAIFSAGLGYYVVGTALTPILLPFTGAGNIVYQDGYGLVNQVGSFTVWQSGLNDFSTWSALAFGSEDGQPDNVVSLAYFHEQVVLFKQDNTAFWINAGSIPFAFQRLEGVYPHRGIAAPNSVCSADESLLWLGQGEEGQGTIYLTDGYRPERVSTFAIEFQIAQYPTITDCVALAYQIEGHTFAVFSFPSGNATWVYDLTASRRMQTPMWFQWGAFVNGQLTRWQPNCRAVFGGRVLVGDYANGNIYALDMDVLTDNGAVKKCLRSWRALGEDAYQTTKCNYLNIGCDTGLNVPPGTNPQAVLRQSLDGGLNWSPEMYASAGVTGATTQSIQFNRLGATRRGLNSDRVFELSTTDQWRIGWRTGDIG